MPNDTQTSPQWFFSTDGHRQGPYTSRELRAAADSGRLGPDDMVWKEGMPNWLKAKKIKGLFPETNEKCVASQGSPGVRASDSMVGPGQSQLLPRSPTSASPAEEPSLPESPPQSKSCPVCGESILLVAKKCKHCGEFIEHTTSGKVSFGKVSFKVSPDFAPLAPPGLSSAYYFKMMDSSKKVLARLWRNQEFSVDIPSDTVLYVAFSNRYSKAVAIKCVPTEDAGYLLSIPKAGAEFWPRCVVTKVDAPA